ncbi:hypothetical protein F2Q69_00025089 [Brassica cretica]|uniref:Uncharacterized protein n=1 Tax=Brassica cretica TaxID=69181 RepID=A0A8S9Q750_BRACR|nr:hypothetical protein F2Q69_00025089 [Brassica cretica]
MMNPEGHPEPDFEPPPSIPSSPRTPKKKVSSKLNRCTNLVIVPISVWTFWRCGNCTSPSLCGNGFARWLHHYLRPVSLAIWLHFDWSSVMNEEDNRNNRNSNSH